jgi:hypothetical protein
MHPGDTTPAPDYPNGPANPAKSKTVCQDSPVCSQRILLIDSDEAHGRRLLEFLADRRLGVELLRTVQAAIGRLKQKGYQCDLVIMNVSDGSQPWLRRLEMLQEAVHECMTPAGPLVLCVSNAKRDHLFELEIERRGGRLVYE